MTCNRNVEMTFYFSNFSSKFGSRQQCYKIMTFWEKNSLYQWYLLIDIMPSLLDIQVKPLETSHWVAFIGKYEVPLSNLVKSWQTNNCVFEILAWFKFYTVTQLAVVSTPKIRGSNPVMGNFDLLSTAVKRRIGRKRDWEWPN